MYKSLSAACILLTCFFSGVCGADEWGAPTIGIFAAEDGSRALKLWGGNSGKKASASLVHLNDNGSEKILKQFKLVNSPLRVLVPPAEVNYFVTLDTYGRVGYEHTLVIYNSSGKVVRDFKLEELLTEEEIRKVTHTETSRWWREGATKAERATFSFEIPTLQYMRSKHPNTIFTESYPEQARLHITLPWGKQIRIRLSTGQVLP